MLSVFNLMGINLIVFIDLVLGNECIDTIGWHDQMNNSTCSDYVAHGWCANKTLSSSLQNNSIILLNFPDLNCCECGKKASLKLPTTARWAQNATTAAGMINGTRGSSLSMLNGNFGIHIAEDDNLYIADGDNKRIVLIQGNLRTAVAVIGQNPESNMSTSGDLSDVFITRTSIYVIDTTYYRVQKWSRNFSNPITVAGIFGVSGGRSNTTAFSNSYNLFVDNYANLYVSDYGNDRVLKFPWNSTSGTAGVMVAGTGIGGYSASQLRGPLGLFVTDNGTLYVTDTGNHRIQKWTLGSTSGVTVAGTGRSGNGSSQLYQPFAVVVDSNGYMYIADGGNNRIMRWIPDSNAGECIAACSGNSGIASNQLNLPTSIAFDSSGSLYVSDCRNSRVQKFQILNETTQITMSLQNSPTPSTVLITNQTTTQTKLPTTTSPIVSTTKRDTTRMTMTTGTQVTTLISTTHSKSSLIKPHFFLILIILLFSIRSFM